MKIVLLLLAVFLAQSVPTAGEKNGADDAGGIMPETKLRTGYFSTALTLGELLGAESAQHYTKIFPTDKPIEWELFVPDSYSSEYPAGIVVYISPTQKGSIPNQWKSVMAGHNLIWIGANGSGNRVSVARRIVFALTAPAVVDREYTVDISRIYLAGFSGGGRTASIASVEYPQIFKGAIFICGADFWDEDTPRQLEQIRSNRYVFVTGSNDHNLEPTRRSFRGFKRAGVLNSRLMVIRDMGHTIPKRREFAKAIEFLDD